MGQKSASIPTSSDLSDQTALDIFHLATTFVLQVLGDARQVDSSAIGIPLVYRAYLNGRLHIDGLSPNTVATPTTSAEVLERCEALFKAEMVAGREVIVWRTLPVFSGAGHPYIRFRCAFVAPADLKVVKDAVRGTSTE